MTGSVKEPVDRLQTAAPGRPGRPPLRSKPVRITVDLAPELLPPDGPERWAEELDAAKLPLADVMRAFR